VPRSPARRIVGIDPDAQALRDHPALSHRIRARGEGLPFQDGTFDLVTANMVLEHVEDPRQLFHEVARVLRSGGVFLAHTPNLHGYTTALTRLVPSGLRPSLAGALQARRAEDVYPTHYRANTDHELRRLGAGSGLRPRYIRHIDSSPQFANFLPLMIPEMLLIRALRAFRLEPFRACLLAAFEKG
jgi:SAM-dependent methyltransferase